MAISNLRGKNDFPPLLHLTYKLQHISDEMLLQKVGIGLSQARIMSVLKTALPHSQRFIAGQLSVTEANISRQLRVMQKQGLVSVKKNRRDARARDVVLTAKGAKKYNQAEKLLLRQNTDLLKSMKKSEAKAFSKAAESLL